MSRAARALVLMMFVSSCGSAQYSAPRNMDDACAIADQRPKYLKAMKRTERRWGVPVAVQMATLYQESKFVGNARTPYRFKLGVIPVGRQSSAYGYAQALDATWDEYRTKTGNRGARRDDIRDATDFMGWYMDGTARRLGIPRHDTTNQYLAYHEGRTGYARGSYRNKPWLMTIATEVGQRAVAYDAQLRACRKIR